MTKYVFLKYALSIIVLLVGALFLWHYIEPGWMLRDKEYASKIEISGYLVNGTDLCKFINKNEITQLSYSDIRKENLYLVVRLRNIGPRVPWGELHCLIDRNRSYKINVSLGPQMPADANYIIPVYGMVFPLGHGRTERPVVAFKWKRLYTK